VRKSERTNLLVCRLAVFAQVLSGLQTGIAVFLQEAEEVLALNEVQLAGLSSLGGYLVRRSRDSRVQSKYFARLSNLQNQSLAITGGGGHLHAAFAEHVDAARHLAFHKENRALWVGGGVLNLVERLQRGTGQSAEERVAA
jgi:hypothetical protein